MAHSKISRTVAASVASLGLVVGLVGVSSAATNGNISNTGQDSSNIVRSVDRNHTTVHNQNSATLTNNNPQWASSGSVHSAKNTTAGDAHSGNVTNTSSMRATVSYDNTAGGGSGGSTSSNTTGTIHQTGQDSTNKVVSKTTNNTEICNNNEVTVTNNNWQAASSGSVSSYANTTAGDATSGNVTNTSTADFNVSYKN